jgi:hypothetical protein
VTTTSLAPNRPDDLPIWARLALIDQDVPIANVLTWNYEKPTRIVAFLNNNRHVFLFRR